MGGAIPGQVHCSRSGETLTGAKSARGRGTLMQSVLGMWKPAVTVDADIGSGNGKKQIEHHDADA
ncbi:MAG: hypothetical protein JO320_00430 [Alphaproteobacteria bacterium]|nr:hypothetical protein [Alphaproteobacteria bacterium]MBV9373529.1 hypothetical protein [Alphaproteobacteria bacterium]